MTETTTSEGATLARVRTVLGQVDFLETRDDIPTLAVAREALLDTLHKLRDAAGFGAPTLVTAIDHYPAEPRFEVYHQLLSIQHSDRVRVRVQLSGQDAVLPSCVGLFPGASFMERECYDMFGIVFDGHGDLRRLLMPQEYGHHPLRKDFPHQGIEPDRLYREWDQNRRREAEREQ